MVGKISTDYTGRTLDILVLDITVRQDGIATGSPLRLPTPAKVCTGVQKTLQAFLTILLTRRGSAVKSTLGTDFMAAAQSGRIRTYSDLRNYYSMASSSAIAQRNAQAARGDERIASASLASGSVDRGCITMKINLLTEAGSSVTFITPVEVA